MPSSSQVSVRVRASGLEDVTKMFAEAEAQFLQLARLLPRVGGTYVYCNYWEKRGHSEIRCTWRKKVSDQGFARFRHHRRRAHPEAPPV